MEAYIIKLVVESVFEYSKNEFSRIRRLKKDAEKLTGRLDTIMTLLDDAGNRTIADEEAFRKWLKTVEDAAFDADNVLDELNYHLLSNKIKTSTTIKGKVLSVFSIFKEIAHQRKMAHKIIEICGNLDSINKVATDQLGLSVLVQLRVAPTRHDACRETDALSVDPIFIGRDKEVSEIVAMLTKSPQELEYSIHAIVGMGGLGKTTLARKVFNHQEIKTHFGSRIWVHVSQKFDQMIVFKKMLAELTSKPDPVESRQGVLKKLQQALEKKTYLLVLDDVWNQDRWEWKDFMESLSGVTSSKGNGIIITTRKADVGFDDISLHELNDLRDEDCWSIIKEKTFGTKAVPPEFEAIGRKIATRCGGLPLAAMVVAGFLGNKSEEKWHSTEQKWLSGVERGNLSKILRLSFDDLSPSSLKKCFAYCSVFPKGDRMVKRELIELWMAEGFLQSDQNNDMESVGEEFFNLLLQNSLLQAVPSIFHHGNEETCMMHDLVHDLACSIFGSSKVDDNNNNNADVKNKSRTRYMSHTHKGDDTSRIQKEEAKYLRTLFLHGGSSSTLFSEFECLHALTLWDYELKKLPHSIRKLIHLRNLNISKTRIEDLPDWIGELHYLQTLRADTDSLKKLPSTFKFLINLRHLYIDRDVELPAKIGRLTSLQTLRYFPVGDKKDSCKIEELGGLNNLKGKLEISNLEKVHDKEEARKANLCEKSKLSELWFLWDSNREDETNDENVLEALQPHSGLRKLVIEGFNGRRFPLWILRMTVQNVPQGLRVRLDNLMEITLSNCGKCEEIPTLGHLPKLKSLYLKCLSNVKSIGYSFYGVGNDTTVVFRALEMLVLHGMPKLTEWAGVGGRGSDVKAFPNLEYMEIENCRQLMSAPSLSFSCLKKLKIVKVDSYMPLANICGSEITSLTNLHIQGLNGGACLPDGLFSKIQNLSELTIVECSALRELAAGLHTLSSLEELIIHNCPNLNWIQYPSGKGKSQGGFTSLHTLEIHQCPHLMDLPFEMVESSVLSLERLCFSGLSGLKNVYNAIQYLENSHRQRELRIVGFKSSPVLQIRPFRRSQRLKIDVSTECLGETACSIITVDSILKRLCRSLHSLELNGLDGLEYLSDGLFNSNQNLLKLEIINCPNLSELADGLHTLNSLEELIIHNCPNLKSIARPSQPQGSLITSLSNLEIHQCPKLMDMPCQMLESSAHSLKILSLRGLRSLQNLPEVIDCLAILRYLRDLYIIGVPRFMSTCVESWHFHNMRVMDIDASVEGSMETSAAIQSTVNGLLQGCCHSLIGLYLKGMNTWDLLPESMQQLSSTFSLTIEDFGIEELPQWFHHLPLTELRLSNCDKLTPQSFVDTMKSLTELTRVFVDRCPQLGDKPEYIMFEKRVVKIIPHYPLYQHYQSLEERVLEFGPDQLLQLILSRMISNADL